MKIHEIINEAVITPYSRSAEAYQNLDDVTNILQTKCPEALRTMKTEPLWRGSNSNTTDILTLDPSVGARVSQNTTNYYTLLMDNSPYMRGWPKRRHSFVCSTSAKDAGNYGTTYAIFPCGNAKIAICPGMDLWETMLDAGIFGKMSFFGRENSRITWDEINHILRKLGFEDSSFEDMQRYATNEELAETLEAAKINIAPEEVIPYFQKAMSPKEVGFMLTSVLAWNPTAYPRNECWFSAPCIAIKKPLYDKWIEHYTRGN